MAIKITHEEFSSRFEREARVISSLNHPNICTVHDVGPNYLVMELVEGETLAERLKQGPCPSKWWGTTAGRSLRRWRKRTGRASFIAISSREHHDREIRVKVLDFGLAKSGHDETLTGQPHGDGHARLYVAGTKARETGRCALRYLFVWLCPLRNADWRANWVGAKRIPSAKMEKIVSRCLDENPARRWQSAAELEQNWQASPPRKPREARLPGAGGRLCRRVALRRVLLVVAAIAGGVYVYSTRKSSAPMATEAGGRRSQISPIPLSPRLFHRMAACSLLFAAPKPSTGRARCM